MQIEIAKSLLNEISQWSLVDPHSHIDPHSPTSHSLADILGYHYYTELAHASGMSRERIEEVGIDPKEKVRRLFEYLPRIANTAQWSWFEAICEQLLGETVKLGDDCNWEELFELSTEVFQSSDWEETVLAKSNLEAVFLTNDFDDPLTGFSTARYVPCLRTDDLVFHFGLPQVRERLESCSGISVHSIGDLANAIRQRFEHFTEHFAKACAISLPPDFSPVAIEPAVADRALNSILLGKASNDDQAVLSRWVFWELTKNCEQFGLPFDLMIGVIRKVYPSGVHQGQDLYDSRVSLSQYAPLFNAFPKVKFPISVLASVTNQELVDYAWIFPNVLTHGHWWYSNTPSFIEKDLRARLEAIPRNKILGYYSDMYKLEFALPKFRMFQRILSRVLAEDFVIQRGWTEQQALQLANEILVKNVQTTFMQAD